MIDYRQYSSEDFAQDESFRHWVLNPTEEITLFWNSWINQNPDKISLLDQATVLLLTVYLRHRDSLSDEDIRQQINILVEEAEETKKKSRLSIFKNWLFRVASLIILISGLSC